ncbi:hypothetical protein BS17DRAFT_583882 [Gyrodon lividus]|nr:hypothetical protein BS17DRAFT_583882 [Gyrodon lividus]
MMSDPQAQHSHLRSRSEPSSPLLAHKNVHFPDQEGGLATVRIFNRSARPAALSNPPNNNGDETETEGDETPPNRCLFPASSSTHYHHYYEIDPTKSSPVPSPHPSHNANVHLDSLTFSPPPSSPSAPGSKPHLSGSILVRNLAFEKHVAVRFTLDEWQTVSEVSAHYLDSIPTLPSHILPSPEPPSPKTVGDLFGPLPKETGWDRFTFNIRLEDYAHALSTRVLWLAARYRVGSTYPVPGSTHNCPGGEWWDNNGGKNYSMSFRPTLSTTTPITPRRPRRDTLPASIISSQTKPPLSFPCLDHALGLLVSQHSNEVSPPTASLGPQDNHPTPFHIGKLSLSNYAPPVTRSTSSTSSPSVTTIPRRRSPPPLITSPKLAPPVAQRLGPHTPNRDEDSASPTSSTLSTPTVSPTIVPRVIVGGQPATSLQDDVEREDDLQVTVRPVHIRDWEWSASSKPPTAGPHRHMSDSWPVPGARASGLPPGGQGLNNESLYNAFVTQWGPFGKKPPSIQS